MIRLLRGLAKTSGWFVALVLGGTICLLIASSFIGYVPYSDRPGPGWRGWRGGVTFREMWFFVSWGILYVVPVVIYGVLLSLFGLLLQWIRTPRWLSAVLGGVLSTFLAGDFVATAGWMIAIGEVPILGAAMLGCIFGAWLLPKQSAQSAATADFTPTQRLVIGGVFCVATAGVFVPRFYDPCVHDQGLTIAIVEWRPRLQPLPVPQWALTDEELARLRASGVSGRVAVNVVFGYGGRGKESRVVIVMEPPLGSPVRLPQPDGASVIYIQDAQGWRMIPRDAATLRRAIRLTPAENEPAKITIEPERACGDNVRSVEFN